jgi:hypothetical protein
LTVQCRRYQKCIAAGLRQPQRAVKKLPVTSIGYDLRCLGGFGPDCCSGSTAQASSFWQSKLFESLPSIRQLWGGGGLWGFCPGSIFCTFIYSLESERPRSRFFRLLFDLFHSGVGCVGAADRVRLFFPAPLLRPWASSPAAAPPYLTAPFSQGSGPRLWGANSDQGWHWIVANDLSRYADTTFQQLPQAVHVN